MANAEESEVIDALFDCAAWDSKNRWRRARVAEIDAALDHHWAKVTLQAVRADDPLAFGIDRLRGARHTYDAELASLNDTIPPDRRKELRAAEAEVSYRRGALAEADDRVADARMGLEEAERRRWSLRDRGAVERAATLLHTAEGDQRLAANGLSIGRGRATSEREAVEAWVLATKEIAGRRRELVTALDQIGDALRLSRPDRVRELAADPTSDLWMHLGPPPESRGGRAAWCGIAERVEAWRDRASTSRPSRRLLPEELHPLLGHRPVDQWVEWGQLNRLLAHCDEVVAMAGSNDGLPARTDTDLWQMAVAEGLHVCEGHEQLKRDRGLEL